MRLLKFIPGLAGSAFLFLSCGATNAQSWQLTADYPIALYQADMVEYAGKLYVAGGLAASPVANVSVGYLGPDGSVLSWVPTTPLPMPNLPGLAAHNGWIYAALANGAICRARILPGGGLDTWIVEPQSVEPSLAYSTMLKVHHGSLYLFGRWQFSTGDVIRIAPINGDGSVGAWTTGALPAILFRPAVQFFDNRVYVAGGLTPIFFFYDLYGYAHSAPIFPDGTLGAWRREADLPARLWQHSSVVVSNDVYIMGGLTNQDNRSVSTAIYRGTISGTDNIISKWPMVESLPSPFVFGNAAVYSPASRNIYLLGGANAAGQMSAQVWRKSLGPPPELNNAPEAAISVSPLIELPGLESPVVLCRAGFKARVTLDGSASRDADNDPLTFEWDVDGLAVSSDVVATADLAVGKHSVSLKADDGKASDSKETSVDVVPATGALDLLIAMVTNSTIPEKRKTPLLASLGAAETSLNRGNQIAALNQLAAFQRKLPAQIAGSYPDLAVAWSEFARLIAETLAGQL